MTGRKPIPAAMPVRFDPTEAGNFVIWDNGGAAGQRRYPYLRIGEIQSEHFRATGKRWNLYVDGRLLVGNLPTLQAAKNAYMDWRNGGADALAVTTPITPQEIDGWRYVEITCYVWDRADGWRSRVFSAMRDAGHEPTAIQAMLATPRSFTPRERGPCYRLHLPDPIADSLIANFAEADNTG